MLTRMRFKNWRSLKDVEINDLTPITVFIGENSSGKTNIIDGLYFIREATEEGALRAVQNRGGAEKIRAQGIPLNEPIEVEFAYDADPATHLTYMLGLRFDKSLILPDVAELLRDDELIWLDATYDNGVGLRQNKADSLHGLSDPPFGTEQTVLASFGGVSQYREIFLTFQFITQRWQLLDENFMPPLALPSGKSGDLTLIDRCADNVPIMLDFLQKVEPDLYKRLQSDLQWLFTHVDTFHTISDEREIRLSVVETAHKEQEAPTISAGTARIFAILAAYYALEARTRAKLPGLVVIEEPDTALNPGLIQKFVELLRNYVDGENPRQFILTTHNPTFLNYFRPEEVRVVSRDENGYTHVDKLSDDIREIWVEKYGNSLGDAWLTNSIGGFAE